MKKVEMITYFCDYKTKHHPDRIKFKKIKVAFAERTLGAKFKMRIEVGGGISNE